MLLDANGVKYKYNDGTWALKGVNMQLTKGSFSILMGPNGSGKTTFFRNVMGLLKPNGGEITLNGKTLKKYTKEDLYRHIGFVFQDPNDQLFAPTVGDDVSFGPANLKLSPAEIEEKVNAALDAVGMLHFKHKPIHYLSYGQKKRTAIAGVLAMEPELIILDEPTAGLDPGGVRELMQLLVKMNKKLGITILMATHDVDLVPLYADKIFLLFDGKILLAGSPKNVFSDKEAIRSTSMRLPRVAHLGEILKDKDHLPIEGLPLTIGEARHMFISAFRGEGEKDGFA